MLSRTAAWAAVGRTTASTSTKASAIGIRHYARRNWLDCNLNISDRRSSIKDQVWKPSVVTPGASSLHASKATRKSSCNSKDKQNRNFFNVQKEADKGAKLARSTMPSSEGASPSKTETVRSAEQYTGFPKSQEEYQEPQSSGENNVPTSNSPGSSESTEQSIQPLPDLRQGIPSTFETEFGGPQPSPISDEYRHQHILNITEDPTAESSSRGGGKEDPLEGHLPKSAYETSLDRRRNRMANYASLSFIMFLLAGATYLGREWDDEDERKIHPDVPDGWSPVAVYERARARMSGQMSYYTEPTFPKLLPDVDNVQVPPYTLVISLEDLLIHSEWSREHGWRTAKRPGADYFIRYLSQYYELVVFTSLPYVAADQIIKKLDPYRIIMWPLFREATRYEKGDYIKDLSYLNRDLSKVILIDTKAIHTKLQPENSIILGPWKGNPSDKELVALIPFLEYVASMGIEDVRKVLASYEGKHIPTEFAAREALAREAFNKHLAEERAKRPKHSGLSFLTNKLGMRPQGLAVGEQSAAEGFEQGKMLSDQIRERGQKQYELLEREIRENGEKWLKEMAEEEKKAQEEQMKSMKSGMFGVFGGGKAT